MFGFTAAMNMKLGLYSLNHLTLNPTEAGAQPSTSDYLQRGDPALRFRQIEHKQNSSLLDLLSMAHSSYMFSHLFKLV